MGPRLTTVQFPLLFMDREPTEVLAYRHMPLPTRASVQIAVVVLNLQAFDDSLRLAEPHFLTWDILEDVFPFLEGPTCFHLLGGYDGRSAVSITETLDVGDAAAQWKRGVRLDLLRSGAAAAVTTHGTIYVVGGYCQIDEETESKASSTGVWLNIQNGWSARSSWKPLPPMKTPRVGHKLFLMGRSMVVVGGFDGQTTLSSVEILPIGQGPATWVYGPGLIIPRYGHDVAVLHGTPYVVGGFSGFAALSHVERFDFVTQVWVPAAPLCVPREYVAVAALDGYLYAVGGRASILKVWDTTERYDPLIGKWSMLQGCCMSCSRYGHSLGVFGGSLYVIGGYDPGEDPQGVERLQCRDDHMLQWVPTKSPSKPRVYSAVVSW